MFGHLTLRRALSARSPARRSPARPAALAVAVLTFGLNGCCALASWACGPDRSTWISVDRSSPELSLDTFREALRRDDQRETFFSLSENLKARFGVPGLVEWQIAWDRIHDEYPSFFVLGDASVVDTAIDPDGRHRFDLEIAGERVRTWFRPQFVNVLELRKSDGTSRQLGEFLRPSDLRRYLQVPAGDRIEIRVNTPELEALSVDPDATVTDGRLQARIDPVNLVRVGIFQEWKLDDFASVEATDG